MNIKIIFIVIMLIITVAVAGFAVFTSLNKKTNEIDSFQKCQDAGYIILESYPLQCKTPEGKTFTQIINPENTDFNEKVTLSAGKHTILPDGLQMTLVGINDSRCPGGAICVWAGEITTQFSVVGGKIYETKEFKLGTVNAKSASLGGYTFTLNDANLRVATFIVNEGDVAPVVPSKPNDAQTGDNTDNNAAPVCYVTGCNGEICSNEKAVASTCFYRQEYVCYQNAKCEKQKNGQCDWTQTKELKTCFSKALSSGQGFAQ